MRWYFTVVLICNSLMTCDVEQHLFVCLFLICVTFGEVFVQIFCPLFNWFLIVSFKSSLCVLCNSLFSDTCFENIFSWTVTCLHSLNSAFCSAEVFNFNEVQFIMLIIGWASGIILRNHWQIPGHKDFLLLSSTDLVVLGLILTFHSFLCIWFSS